MFSPTGLIPWFSKTEGNTYATLLHHPFHFKGKPTQAQEVANEATDPKSSASTTAVPYVFFLFLLEALLQFLVLVFALDLLDSVSYMQLVILSALDVFSYSSYMKMLFNFSLSNRMTCFITAILVVLYIVFLLIKSFGKLLIFPTQTKR